MKTFAYLDAPTGISGDMCLGALVHAGVPLSYLETQLAKLGISEEFQLTAESVQRNQQAATKVKVALTHSAHRRGHQQHADHAEAHAHHHAEAHAHHHAEAQSHTHKHVHHHHEHHAHGFTHSSYTSQTSSGADSDSEQSNLEYAAHQAAHSHVAHNHVAHSHHRVDHSHGGRRLPEIESLIQQADIPQRAADWSLAVFRLLAEAEASVHGIPPEKVHFHEVGATDAIVDIVGTCLGLDWLNIDEIVCSPLPTGGGTVRCEHGLLPVPAPAVLSMMASAQIPVYGNGIEKELVTPTGCAIAATLAKSFGPPPPFTPQKIGLGAGGRDLILPNILRLWIGTTGSAAKASAQPFVEVGTHKEDASVSTGESASREGLNIEDSNLDAASVETSNETKTAIEGVETEEIVELKTQIDDCSPQAIAHTFDLLFAAGAADVFSQPVTMKKNRLGTLLSVLCPKSAIAECERILFTETTTLGIRRSAQVRSVLFREIATVKTEYGEIDVKIGRVRQGQAVLNVHPEYEHCAKAARAHQVSLQQVQQAATAVAMACMADSMV